MRQALVAIFKSRTEALIQRAKRIAEQAWPPHDHLESAHTHARDRSKAAITRAIAVQDRITKGPPCISSVPEPWVSLAIAGNHKTQRLEVVRRNRRCLHLYWYPIQTAAAYNLPT
jgi:hypothetical protein